MFTGIIECIGKVRGLHREGTNLHVDIEAPFAPELRVDQSISHNGVCLTVVVIEGSTYRVTAVDETLSRSNLGKLVDGNELNLERAMISGARLDGHMVQGHIDQTAECLSIANKDGSWIFEFEFIGSPEFLLVEKGSICVDGVSLTVSGLSDNGFSVAIIPYTFEHTLFKNYVKGSIVNLEFDVIGKYVHQYMQHFRNKGEL